MIDIFTLKGRSPALLISIAVHGLILLFLNSTDNHVQKKVALPIKAIKSYLYKRPEVKRPLAPPQVVDVVDPVEETPEQTDNREITLKPENKPNIIQATKAPIKESTKEESIEPETKISNQKNDNELLNDSKIKPAFSALNQLKKLQSSINQKAIRQGLQQYQQHSSVSVMHGKPNLVPHSIKQVTEKRQKELATQHMSPNMKTIKGDDGFCFIERDLSNVGMAGVTSRETFTCAKSKFDVSFRDHMRKVKAKLGK